MGNKKEKTNILEFAESCFSGFDKLPFNQIDAVILATLSYVDIHENFSNNFSDEGMPVTGLLLAEHFKEMFKTIPSGDKLKRLVFAVCSSPRYRNIRIKYYRNEMNTDISLQFSGVVYSISDSFHVVAFRGTDKSFVGWKEDVLLIMKKAASSQMMAINYLNGVAEKLKGDIVVTGHSKGGNLAAYASAHCHKEVRDRIAGIYNLDGPGFLKKEMEYPGMLEIKERITKILPKASPIGLILENETKPVVINSCNKGVRQHETFSWVIDGMKFEQVKGKKGKNVYQKFTDNINTWAETVNDEEILILAESLFGLFEELDYVSYDEIGKDITASIKGLLKSFKGMDSEKRRKMVTIFKDALTGKKKEKSQSSKEDYNLYGVDWEQIDCMMNDLDAKQFSKDYDLFLNSMSTAGKKDKNSCREKV